MRDVLTGPRRMLVAEATKVGASAHLWAHYNIHNRIYNVRGFGSTKRFVQEPEIAAPRYQRSKTLQEAQDREGEE